MTARLLPIADVTHVCALSLVDSITRIDMESSCEDGVGSLLSDALARLQTAFTPDSGPPAQAAEPPDELYPLPASLRTPSTWKVSPEATSLRARAPGAHGVAATPARRPHVETAHSARQSTLHHAACVSASAHSSSGAMRFAAESPHQQVACACAAPCHSEWPPAKRTAWHTSLAHASQTPSPAEAHSERASAVPPHPSHLHTPARIEPSQPPPPQWHTQLHAHRSSVPSSRPIPAPPPPLTIVPTSAPVARKCIAFGEALNRCHAGERTSCTIQSRNRWGEHCALGGETFVVRLRGPTEEKASVHDEEDGTYAVRFTLPISGHYSMSITLRGQHICGSPFKVKVCGGAVCDARRSTLRGTSLTIAGEETLAVVQTVNTEGERMISGGEHFRAWLQLEKDFYASAQGCAAVRVLEQANENCTPVPRGFSSAQRRRRKSRTVPDDSTSLRIEDRNDGSYVIGYRTVVAGRYILSVVRVKDEAIVGGEPQVVDVLPGAAEAAYTRLQGDGLYGARAGVQTSFEVIAHDRFNNRCTRGGDAFHLEVRAAVSANGVSCKLEDLGDGRYCASYRVDHVGTSSVSVSLRGQPIGDPIHISVTPGPTAAAACTLELPAAGTAARRGQPKRGSPKARERLEVQMVAGVVSSLTVRARDVLGHPQDSGGNTFLATLYGPAPGAAYVTDRGDGTYTVTLKCNTAGSYQLQLLLRGDNGTHSSAEELTFSPIELSVQPASISQVSEVEWRSLPRRIVAGEPLVGRVRASDAWGNRVNDVSGITGLVERLRFGAELELEPDRIPAAIQLYQGGDWHAAQHAEIEFCSWPLRAGSWMPFLVACTQSTRAPHPVAVGPAEPDAAQSHVQGTGLHSGVAGRLATFSVLLRDRFGNCVTEGSDLHEYVEVAVRRVPAGGLIDAARSMSPSGEVRVCFSSEQTGPLSIEVGVGGRPISGSPFSCVIHPNEANVPSCVASGPGLHDAVAGCAANFEVRVCDQFGNSLNDSSITREFQVKLQDAHGTILPCDSRCRPSSDSCYELSYTPFLAGESHLFVSHQGVAIRGSPFLVLVLPGAPYAPHCSLSGTGCAYARPGRTSFVWVHLADRWHNPCALGSARLDARGSGPTQPIVSMIDVDGRHRVSVRYGLAGDYLLSVALRTARGLASIPGSPLTVTVGAGHLENRMRRWYEDAIGPTWGTRSFRGFSTNIQVFIMRVMRAWKRYVGKEQLSRMLRRPNMAGTERLYLHAALGSAA